MKTTGETGKGKKTLKCSYFLYFLYNLKIITTFNVLKKNLFKFLHAFALVHMRMFLNLSFRITGNLFGLL